MSTTTKPRIGDVVWFWPAASDRIHRTDKALPLSAIIASVWNDNSINLAVFDSNGNSMGRTSVTFVQDHDVRPKGHFAEWPKTTDPRTRICPTPGAGMST